MGLAQPDSCCDIGHFVVDYASARNKCEFDAIAEQPHYFGAPSRWRRIKIATERQISRNSRPSPQGPTRRPADSDLSAKPNPPGSLQNLQQGVSILQGYGNPKRSAQDTLEQLLLDLET
jgi:hypothetical protein